MNPKSGQKQGDCLFLKRCLWGFLHTHVWLLCSNAALHKLQQLAVPIPALVHYNRVGISPQTEVVSNAQWNCEVGGLHVCSLYLPSPTWGGIALERERELGSRVRENSKGW